jgi:nucleoside-diphosphate-sugar epimerase
MQLIIGGSGRLGQALARRFGPDHSLLLPRSLYGQWPETGTPAAIGAALAPWAHSGSTVFVTAGLLDPKLAPEQHERVNLDLPRRIIEAAAPLGIRVVTFGTVMEALLAQQNPYVRSKAALGRLVEQQAAAGADVCHIRVHTLFGGGAPSPFMLLGLMLAALRAGATFKMTSGKQLREYHDVDDEAAALAVLNAAGLRGVHDLSNGQPVSLCELARAIFRGFGAEDQLELGALPEPADENYTTVFQRHRLLSEHAYRAPLPAVVNYLREYAAQQERSQ